MTKTDKLIELIEKSNGYVLISEAQALGISRVYIKEYLKNNNFEKVAHGLYKSPDVWTDQLYIATLKSGKAVCSFDTALMLHGLTEREPATIYLTVPRKYNASRLRSRGISIYQVKEEWFDLGRTIAKTTYGNEVPVYDMERTICDLVRVKDKKDPQMFAYAMKEYAKSPSKNLPRLMTYAKEFGIEAEIRQYMEVLL